MSISRLLLLPALLAALSCSMAKPMEVVIIKPSRATSGAAGMQSVRAPDIKTVHRSRFVAPDAAITPAELRRHIEFLAGDELAGRATGEVGCDVAALYIATKFKSLGLEPAGDDGTYFQHYTVNTGVSLGEKNALIIRLPGAGGRMRGWRSLKVNEGFVPTSFSGSGKARGEMVFAGYGISAERFDYDDYAGLDVNGRVVVVLAGYPGRSGGKTPFGMESTFFADLRFKATAARNRGAKALIVARGPRDPKAGEAEKLPALKLRSTGGNAGIPVARIRSRTLAELFKVYDRDLEALQKQMDESAEPAGFELTHAEAGLAVSLVAQTRRVSNVLGVLPGSDPRLKDEYVVLGAHYDHLGLGGTGSLAPDLRGQVHNGADDNASGTAAIMEIAEQLAGGGRPTRRSVLVAAFSGEEMGLLGSAHYVKSPAVPLKDTVAMLNMDMVGRMKDKRLILGGVDTAEGFRKLAGDSAKQAGIALSPSGDGFGASDHASFYGKKIPVLFFFTGVHDDYHRPSDDADKINYDGAARVARYATRLLRSIADAGERPKYKEVKREGKRELRGGFGAYLGTVPDYTESDKGGVRLQSVRPDSPASRGGLKAGDTIVEFAGTKVENIYDYTYALREHRPGQEVTIVALREGKRVELRVTLGSRE